LFAAVDRGDKDVAELLLANKAEVNAKDGEGRTPLFAAVRRGGKDVAELLLANKAEVNAKDNDGRTPLHLAMTLHSLIEHRYGSSHEVYGEIAEWLRQHGGHE
jgi:ankyrin repeat protein